MIGPRTYLDWNATAPLRPEARAAMLEALELTGNPSSVHAEGRAARSLVERARRQLAEAFGASGGDIVFTSGATEAAALACGGRGLLCAPVEHEAVAAWCRPELGVAADGAVGIDDPAGSALQLANSETGVVQDIPDGLKVCDATQGFGKIPFAFDWSGVCMALLSAHKIGGPKGIGALVVKRGTEIAPAIRGGGQEMGRRAGTENIAAIAGFGAAAEAASRDLAAGVWDRVAEIRNILESALVSGSKETIFIGNEARRLPGTSCFASPGWKGETQVMQMDLAGFAVSAGSACSSGKVRESAVLRAMGHASQVASSAIRVSIGPGTSEEDVLRFAESWAKAERKYRARAA
ncbi:cysteine desulfurase family protein [Profundibacterium mesophilum]|uniref:Cysteine desulfurase n=1 Tax=Profundibacterium mesophilum KAUST100406-0324 TaxID=1037889 RepID=A0A921NRK9_9RHOB|nr:aminotransferase class V-fold PLP-dependent enzyme [Profundibacterium mesophilum]KAF0675034.1 Cysteine desulfurase [Profundibacterium mesophilum KAUST100406-0324]